MSYRYSLDPFLLADFVVGRPGDRVADLGTGGGILPLLLTQRFERLTIHAFDIQAALLAEAESLLAECIARRQVMLHHVDVREMGRSFEPQCCEVVITNPPYRPPGKGQIAPHPERAAARHELHGGLDDFLGAAAYLLGDGGRFYVVYLAERLTDLLEGMRKVRLEPKRLRCVHGRIGDVAKMVLVEGRKGGGPGMKVEEPLIVYDGEDYTPEVQAIYEQFSDLWT